MRTTLTLPLAAALIIGSTAVGFAQGTTNTGPSGTLPRDNRDLNVTAPPGTAAPQVRDQSTGGNPPNYAPGPGATTGTIKPDVPPSAANPATGPGSGVQGGGGGGAR